MASHAADAAASDIKALHSSPELAEELKRAAESVHASLLSMKALDEKDMKQTADMVKGLVTDTRKELQAMGAIDKVNAARAEKEIRKLEGKLKALFEGKERK